MFLSFLFSLSASFCYVFGKIKHSNKTNEQTNETKKKSVLYGACLKKTKPMLKSKINKKTTNV